MLVSIVTQAKSSNISTSKLLLFIFSIMKKAFCIPLLLLVTFLYATSVVARNDPSGNEVKTEGKLANEGVTKPSLKGPNEDEKFIGYFYLKHKLKGYFHKKPIYYKPIPTYKPFHKATIVEKSTPSVVEPESFLKHKHYFFKKPIIPIVKPVYVPIYKPIPKVIPIVKPIH
ncbi:uncharacterized protein LOC127075728 [Lathyrus oleraceus]|uniref:Uncharacterized protein n=1 Tax=Pisum sativum TaxID=3888 RepID=A0A9D5AVZ6_PEA|nr:uncharacterized protein LOC127075728 [Pisum sativum]KAI5421236.1 hypothetical protein KIW84_044898 [Pisum sativum]